MKKTKKEIIIAVLALALVIGVVIIFIIQNQNNKFKKEITAEKEALSKELQTTITKFEVEKDSITKTYNLTKEELATVTYQLEDSHTEIKALQNDLKRAKGSYGAIAKLKRQLKSIKLNNESLFKKIDSIKSVNDSLTIEVANTKTELNEEKLYSKELSLKLSDATKIQITDVVVYAVKESSKGYKATTRSRKADAFKVEYNVLNNKALSGEKCDVYYILKGIDGEVLNSTGEFKYKEETKKYTSGDRLTLTGDTMLITHLIPVNDVKLGKGVYTIEFYSADGLLSKRIVTLKAGIF